MKKIFILLISLFAIAGTITIVYSDSGWDDSNSTGTGTGDFSASAYPDSAANPRPLVQGDTARFKIYESSLPTHWDLYSTLSVDSLTAPGDSITGWDKSSFVSASADTAWRILLQSVGSATGGQDSLLLGFTGFPTVDNPDSFKIWLACSNKDSVRVDFRVITATQDTIINAYNISLTGGATMTAYTGIFVAGKTFLHNRRYKVLIRCRTNYSEWIRIGKAEVW